MSGDGVPSDAARLRVIGAITRRFGSAREPMAAGWKRAGAAVFVMVVR